jgi:hypothetical protein
MFFGFSIGSVLIGGEHNPVQHMESSTWAMTAFESAGTVLRSESSYAGTNTDIVTCIASGLGPYTARIRSFIVEYNSEFIWIRFMDENKMTLGYSKKFRRLSSSPKEDPNELLWLSESIGTGQAGYVKERGTWKCQIGENHSLNVIVDYEYNARNVFGLLRKKGHSQAVYHFEKNHDILDANRRASR